MYLRDAEAYLRGSLGAEINSTDSNAQISCLVYWPVN